MNMTIQEQIDQYIAGQPEAKRAEMTELHRRIIALEPKCKLWFLDGTDDTGKVVSNPSIGYGSRTIKYADGSSKEFYRVGLSANKSGISVYVLGLEDKKFLAETFGNDIGKATVTGYCIRFKTLKNVNTDVLDAAIQAGFDVD